MSKRVSKWTAAHCAAVFLISIALQQANAGDRTDQGRVTYAQNCSHCHGPNMVNSGTVTPDLRAFPDDKPRFIATVKQGKNGKMPPWGDLLNDEQIEDIWTYLSSRRNP